MKRIQVYFPKDLYLRAKQMAKDENMSFSAFIREGAELIRMKYKKKIKGQMLK